MDKEFLLDAENKPIRGMLADYINEKAAAYVPPYRGQRHKGQVEGFGLEKYLATLLYFTNIPLQTQAEGLKVSYELLRKWRSEKRFYKFVGEHHEEVSRRFWDYVKEHAMKEKAVIEKLYQLPPQEFAAAEIPGCSIEGKFDDRFLYDPTMSPDFPTFDKPRSEWTEDERIIVMEGLRILRMIGWMPPERQETVQRRAREGVPKTLAALKETFTQESLTADDQRHGIILLRLLEADLETLGIKTEAKETQPKRSIDVRLAAVGGRK